MQASCKRQIGENDPCRLPANVKMENLGLAGALQTPKWRKVLLQNFCKRQIGEKCSCRTSANVKLGKSALAEVLQTSNWRKWLLQKFCKRQIGEKCFCRTSANVKLGKSALAELLQTSNRRKWLLRDSRKRQIGENGSCGTPANAVAESDENDLQDSRYPVAFYWVREGAKGTWEAGSELPRCRFFSTFAPQNLLNKVARRYTVVFPLSGCVSLLPTTYTTNN